MSISIKSAKVRQATKLNRVGSHAPAAGVPQTIGQRMAERRLELRLTQEQVASQVRFTPKSGRRRNLETVLSRTAYCMYETDSVEPDLAKIVEIAKALATSAGWLAFGERKPEPLQPLPDRDINVTQHLANGEDATKGEQGDRTSEVPVVIIKFFSR